MTQADNIKDYCIRLKLSYIHQKLSAVILKAQESQPTYIDFLEDILRMESEMRESHTRDVRVKMSRIPLKHNLDDYDFNFVSGISQREMNELRQLAWMEQAYNIVLMGPLVRARRTWRQGLYMMPSSVERKDTSSQCRN